MKGNRCLKKVKQTTNLWSVKELKHVKALFTSWYPTSMLRKPSPRLTIKTNEDRMKVTETEGKKEGERGGWRDRGGGGPRSSGTQGAHRQWGNNDMKEPSWRSHAALAHLRRHKISWPLHTHTHAHTHEPTCMHAITHTHLQTHTSKDTHTHSGKPQMQPEAVQQREVSYEPNI